MRSKKLFLKPQLTFQDGVGVPTTQTPAPQKSLSGKAALLLLQEGLLLRRTSKTPKSFLHLDAQWEYWAENAFCHSKVVESFSTVLICRWPQCWVQQQQLGRRRGA
jgi:hypothetical protein